METGREAMPMTTSTIDGFAAMAVKQQLEPFSYEAPKLNDHDVRVAITHCGVCHTDIHAIDDYYDISTYPFVPGHEIVGKMIEAGSHVTELRVGDRVGVGWQGRSCGECEWCLMGEEQLCRKIVSSATWTPYGGFSSSVVVDSRFAYPLPDGMPSEVAAVLMCAGATVYNPLKKYRANFPQKIGIIGVGGLGHLAIQFARALDYDVTAISSSPEKKAEALGFGAHRFLLSSDKDVMAKEEFSFDFLLCTVSNCNKWEPLLDTIKKRGKLILAGFPDMSFNSTDLVAHELSINATFLCNRVTMREMLAFAHEQEIMPKIELMPMSKVNEALKKVRENKARYRIVLVNEAPTSKV